MTVAATRPSNFFPGVIELLGRDKNYFYLYLCAVQLLRQAKLDRQSPGEVAFARLLVLVRENCLVAVAVAAERAAYCSQHHPRPALTGRSGRSSAPQTPSVSPFLAATQVGPAPTR